MRVAPPDRPWADFLEYTAYAMGVNDGYSPFKKGLRWPCLSCYGYGTIYDPDDPPCPVEGNKMRRRIRCQVCCGSGKGSEEHHRRNYEQKIGQWSERLEEFEQNVKAHRNALQILCSAELEALSVFGLDEIILET